MNKLYEKFCNSINYKTYDNIEKGLLLSYLGTQITSSVINLNNIPNFDWVNILSILLTTTYISCALSDGKNHTKDVKEIKGLYQEFICNYNKLNSLFDLKEPISIYVMFNYLTKEGYLSKDKQFQYLNNDYKMLAPFKGIDVINGSGVCRHIGSLLTDILNDYKIDACNINCYVSNSRIDFFPVSKKEYSIEKNISLINKYALNEDERELLLSLFNFLYKQGIYLDARIIFDKEGEDIFNCMHSNHLITYANYDSNSYYLDPTNERILRLDDGRKILYDINGRMLIKNSSCYKIKKENNIAFCSETSKKIIVPSESVSLYEQEQIVKETSCMCEENKDIFEKFYSDNCELYNDISNRLIKIRKKGK